MDRQCSTSSAGSFGGHASGTRRRQSDLMKLAASGTHRVTTTSTVGTFFVLFHGPVGTPYEGGHWQVAVTLTDDYPIKSPSIGFANRIFHPNVDERSGTVCLDVINQTWTPMYDLRNVFDAFLPQLLRYPNPADPLNPEAAALALGDPALYTARVHAHVAAHATAALSRRVVAQWVCDGEGGDDDETTPARRAVAAVGVEASPASTFSRALTDSPPSDFGATGVEADGCRSGGADEDDDDDAPVEIEL